MDYQEMPWSVEDTIDHLEEIRAFLAKQISKVNLDGKAESDIEELNYDFGRAIDALKENMEIKKIGSLEEVRKSVERQQPRKPILKNGKSGTFVDYADGHGEYKVTKWQDWCCPVCGWFVGQRYNASQGRSHDQRKSEYCNECGQHIDWSEEDD